MPCKPCNPVCAQEDRAPFEAQAQADKARFERQKAQFDAEMAEWSRKRAALCSPDEARERALKDHLAAKPVRPKRSTSSFIHFTNAHRAALVAAQPRCAWFATAAWCFW